MTTQTRGPDELLAAVAVAIDQYAQASVGEVSASLVADGVDIRVGRAAQTVSYLQLISQLINEFDEHSDGRLTTRMPAGARRIRRALQAMLDEIDLRWGDHTGRSDPTERKR